MVGFAREVARRVFASELRDSDLSFRENEEQYAPLYLITPTGARCNRVLLMGTLTEKDNLGDDVDYWRGRIADPTGSIFVYAGQYQPDAAHTLAATEPPAFVAVVGKPSVYETEDGKRLISVRAESVRGVDADSRDRWILETAARTLDRIEAFDAFAAAGGAGGFSSGDELLKKSQGAEDASDIGKALHHYSPDLERYRKMVVKAIDFLNGEVSSTGSGPDLKVETAKIGTPAGARDWEEVDREEIRRLEEMGEDLDVNEGPEGMEDPPFPIKDSGRSSKKRKDR